MKAMPDLNSSRRPPSIVSAKTASKVQFDAGTLAKTCEIIFRALAASASAC